MPDSAPTSSSRTRSFWTVAGFLAATLLAAWFLPDVKLGSDATEWLPEEDVELQRLHWFNEQFPHENRVIVTWDGCTLSDPRLKRVAKELKACTTDDPPSGIKDITTPHELIADLEENGIPYESAVDRLRGVLVGKGSDPPALIAVTVHDKESVSDEVLFQTLRGSAKAGGVEEPQLHLGGSRVASAYLDHEILRAAWNPDVPLWQFPWRSPILLTLAASLVLAFAIIRNAWLTTLTLLAGLVTVILSVALVPVTGGTLDMILIVMPTLLLVATLSGGIHMGNYWKHAASVSPANAAHAARRAALVPTSLAYMTTAIGLASLCISPLRPIRQFGFYASIGCFVSLWVLISGLPAMLDLWPPKLKESAASRFNWRAYGEWIARHNRAVIGASLIVFVAAAAGLWWFETETKVIRFFPEHHRVIRDYRFIEGHIAGIIPVDVVVQFPNDALDEQEFFDRMQIVRRVQQAIDDHPEISGSLSLADFADVPLENFSTSERIFARMKLRRLESRIHDGTEPYAINYVNAASRDLVLDDGRTIKAGDEIWRISAQVAVMSDLDYSVLTEELAKAAQSGLAGNDDVGLLVTGMIPLFLRTQQALLEGLINSFGLAFLVIALVMTILLRDLKAGLITMIPNAFPIIIVFGLLSWYGHPVDIGMMITASIVMGIAVDDTLHQITWYRVLRAQGRTPKDAIANALAHCGTAMMQSSVIISVGLLMLFPAELLLIRRFGWLMALLVMSALIADLVLTPALLVGPLKHLGETDGEGVSEE